METRPHLKKSLGQHFITSPGICERIASLLDLKESDQIVEIGPGQGALTNILVKSPHSCLLLLEKDCFWAMEHHKKTARANTILIDALNFSWKKLCNKGSWKIAGNLPYNVASLLIWDIVSCCYCLKKAVFMTQREVAQRLAAKPCTKAYGALSVWVQSFASVKLEFSVAPGCFFPPPKVDSAVVSILPNSFRPDNSLLPSLKLLLSLCFQNRRKQTGTIFRKAGHLSLAKGLSALGIDPALRPEALTPEDFQKLCRYL